MSFFCYLSYGFNFVVSALKFKQINQSHISSKLPPLHKFHYMYHCTGHYMVHVQWYKVIPTRHTEAEHVLEKFVNRVVAKGT